MSIDITQQALNALADAGLDNDSPPGTRAGKTRRHRRQ